MSIGIAEKNRAKSAAYRLRHPERVKATQKSWRERNHESVMEKNRERGRRNYQRDRDKILTAAKSYYEAHADERREYARAYAQKNRQKATDDSRTWAAANREKSNRIKRAWNRENVAAVAALNAKRRAKKYSATPGWADFDAIEQIYTACRDRTLATGVPHHVDHIYPLQGETATGLHVQWNLQILTASQNCAKGNRCPL